MEFPIKGGVAVITGAASGIGAALAAKLATEGCHLALVDRNNEGLAATAAAARTHGVTVSEHILDVSQPEGLAALPDAVLAIHGRASILVNNAGVALAGTFAQVTLDEFTWLFDINFWAPVRLTRAFMGVLAREPAAHIVNLSSLFGLIAPPGQTAYAAAKFGLRGFSEALRHELVGSSISLTVVHPGGIRTNIANNARLAQSMDPELARVGVARLNKMLTTPPQIAAEQITHAIRTRKGRLLIGNDAKRAEIIQRLFPQNYWRILTRKMSAKGRR
jgi:short-subunit dehydrogenase